LHLSESLSKYNIRCTVCVNQNIMDQKSFDDTRSNHSIIVRVILELKVLLREGNWDLGPS
jgi:cytochrome c-type biogenesis protein CcmH/NrfF